MLWEVKVDIDLSHYSETQSFNAGIRTESNSAWRASVCILGSRIKEAFNSGQINLTHIQKMQLGKYVNLDVSSNAS